MATLTIRNLGEDVKAALRVRAAIHDVSMEEEVRRILRDAVANGERPGLGSRIRDRFAAFGLEELPLPLRDDAPRPADL